MQTESNTRSNHQPSLDAIWNLLLDVNTKISNHVEEEARLRPHVEELVDILQKSKGALVLLKTLVYIVSPLLALIYWVKDHVKL